MRPQVAATRALQQAEKNLHLYLASDTVETVILKQKLNDWQKARVAVKTIQSLLARNRCRSVYQSQKVIGPEGLKLMLAYIQANVRMDELVRVA